MKNKCFIRLLSHILTFILVFNFLSPLSVFPSSADITDDSTASDYVAEEPTVLREAKDPEQLQKELDDLTYEVEALREENVKHFCLPDGTYQAVVYGDAIHRQNADGEWEEIDNSLSEINGAISTENARVKFAKKITGNENIYTLHEGSYKITVGLEGATKKVEGVVTNHNAESEGMTKLQKLQTIENISSSIVYKDILNGIDLEYIIISNHIKENIIVNKPAETYSYTFTLALNGLTAELVSNEILLSDSETNEVVYNIPAPYMYDAADKYSYDVHYTLTNLQNGKYEFTVTADKNWINADERAFPVVIDPALIDIAQQNDTYVNSSAPSTNYGRVHDLYVSNTCETYIKFTTPNLPNGVSITRATISLPYYYNVTNNKAINISLYKITSSWVETSVSWNNKPTTTSSAMQTNAVYANGPRENNPGHTNFDVSDSVKSWYTGTANYGFALKRAGGDNTSVIFVAREKLQVYGQLSIYYSGTDLPQGVYAIGRSDAVAYFQTSRPSSLAWVLQDINHSVAPNSTSDLDNLFKISYRPNTDDYVIRSMLDNSLVIYPSPTHNAPIAGFRTESDANLSSSYTWQLEYSGGNYYIYQTIGGTTYYIRSASTSHASKLVLTTNKNDTGTKWKFTQYTGDVYEDIVIDNVKYSLLIGETYQYDAYMTSSRVGHNGPVNYQVKTTHYRTTDIATINASTGVLTVLDGGTIKILITYSGAPWVWCWTVNINFEDGIIHTLKNADNNMLMNPDATSSGYGAPVKTIPYSYNNSDSMWKIQHAGNGYYKILNDSTGYYLASPANCAEGAQITQTLYSSSYTLWRFELCNNGLYKIQSKYQYENNPSLYLSVSNSYVIQTASESCTLWDIKALTMQITAYYDSAFLERRTKALYKDIIIDAFFEENSAGVSIDQVLKERYGLRLNVDIPEIPYESYPYTVNCQLKNDINHVCSNSNNSENQFTCSNLTTGDIKNADCRSGYHHKKSNQMLGTLQNITLANSNHFEVLFSGFETCATYYDNCVDYVEGWASIGGSRAIVVTQTSDMDAFINCTFHELLHLLMTYDHGDKTKAEYLKCVHGFDQKDEDVNKGLLSCEVCNNSANAHKFKLYYHND